MLADVALAEEDAALGIEPGGEQDRGGVVDALAQLGRVVVDGDRVQVDDAVDRRRRGSARAVLAVDVLADRADVVAEVLAPGRLDAAEDPRSRVASTRGGNLPALREPPGRAARSRARPPRPAAMPTSSTISCGAFSSEPVSCGGSGSYSIPSWIACATCSPAIRSARCSAMSIPEETPAAVITLPRSTTRSATGFAPSSPSAVAGRPVRGRLDAVEDAGRGEQQRAGADGGRPLGARVDLGDPARVGARRGRAGGGCRRRPGRRSRRARAPRRASGRR